MKIGPFLPARESLLTGALLDSDVQLRTASQLLTELR
jgi:hypothetical protein